MQSVGCSAEFAVSSRRNGNGLVPSSTADLPTLSDQRTLMMTARIAGLIIVAEDLIKILSEDCVLTLYWPQKQQLRALAAPVLT